MPFDIHCIIHYFFFLNYRQSNHNSRYNNNTYCNRIYTSIATLFVILIFIGRLLGAGVSSAGSSVARELRFFYCDVILKLLYTRCFQTIRYHIHRFKRQINRFSSSLHTNHVYSLYWLILIAWCCSFLYTPIQ